jgi:hypothetical protein
VTYRRLIVVALIACASRAIAAQDTVLIPSDREANAQVAQIVASAEAAGLPTNAIVGKVRYGVNVMRSKPSAIVAAARALAERLELARVALEPNPSQPEIEAGANALAEKATPDALKAVRSASGRQPVLVPLGVLTQLVTSKVPVKRATEIVVELIKRGATGWQLATLGNDVQQDVRVGRPAMVAVEDRARGLTAVLAAEPGLLGGDKVNVSAPAPSDLFGTSSSQPKSGPRPPKRP